MKKQSETKKNKAIVPKQKKETSLVSGPHLSFVGLLQLDSLWARELGFFSSRTEELEDKSLASAREKR